MLLLVGGPSGFSVKVFPTRREGSSSPTSRKVEVPVEYLGFTIPDAFVYGYGLDRAQFDHNLPFITSQD
ncbi:hypothetical protein DAETH_06680 [Deinococcus aetherius]|uniref:Hypoxanthine phosphoribosyltransferase n=1 Tax=Deinococcus aetherius TaxID=200252 RepID=A0ABM8AAJ0_9DEIO|nr:hypothetical protein DAETH_06680 [Deinococcus aetherius]